MSAEYSKTQKSTRENAGKKPDLKAPAIQDMLTPEVAMTDMQHAVADSRTASPTGILGLQRQYGNYAVQRLLVDHNIQAKLTVGAVHDAYEQEADRVAAQVMSMPEPAPKIQRMGEEEEDEIQAKPLAATLTPLVQRAVAAEEDEDLQAKFIQRVAALEEEIQAQSIDAGSSFEPTADFESRLAATRGGGKPLPDQTREFMEQRFGADFSDVRVHTGDKPAKLNQEIHAQAFTHGQDIYLGQGNENTESSSGRQLLAHELTHVTQQSTDLRTRPAIQRLSDMSSIIPKEHRVGFPRYAEFLASFANYANTISKAPSVDKSTLLMVMIEIVESWLRLVARHPALTEKFTRVLTELRIEQDLITAAAAQSPAPDDEIYVSGKKVCNYKDLITCPGSPSGTSWFGLFNFLILQGRINKHEDVMAYWPHMLVRNPSVRDRPVGWTLKDEAVLQTDNRAKRALMQLWDFAYRPAAILKNASDVSTQQLKDSKEPVHASLMEVRKSGGPEYVVAFRGEGRDLATMTRHGGALPKATISGIQPWYLDPKISWLPVNQPFVEADPRKRMIARPAQADAEESSTISLTPTFKTATNFPHIEDLIKDHKAETLSGGRYKSVIYVYLCGIPQSTPAMDPLDYGKADLFTGGEYQIRKVPQEQIWGIWTVERIHFGSVWSAGHSAKVIRYQANTQAGIKNISIDDVHKAAQGLIGAEFDFTRDVIKTEEPATQELKLAAKIPAGEKTSAGDRYITPVTPPEKLKINGKTMIGVTSRATDLVVPGRLWIDEADFVEWNSFFDPKRSLPLFKITSSSTGDKAEKLAGDGLALGQKDLDQKDEVQIGNKKYIHIGVPQFREPPAIYVEKAPSWSTWQTRNKKTFDLYIEETPETGAGHKPVNSADEQDDFGSRSYE